MIIACVSTVIIACVEEIINCAVKAIFQFTTEHPVLFGFHLLDIFIPCVGGIWLDLVLSVDLLLAEESGVIVTDLGIHDSQILQSRAVTGIG